MGVSRKTFGVNLHLEVDTVRIHNHGVFSKSAWMYNYLEVSILGSI